MSRIGISLSALILLGFITGCGGSGSGTGTGTGGGGQTAPTVSSISPTTVAAGATSLTLTVNGTGFLSTTTVEVGGVADATTYVSSTQVTAAVTATQLASGGELSVIALNGSASSGSGAAVNLEVTNPVPTITTLTPAALMTGGTSQVISVTGTGFVASTVIDVNGSARTTAFVSGTQVNVTLSTADLATAGTLSLTAVNPSPGGGTSAASTISITNPEPYLFTFSPYTVVAGGTAPTTVAITGLNFIPASTVQVNGSNRTTTYVSATQLTFQLTVADQATVQGDLLTVVNPAPGGGTSAALELYVLAQTPTPVITQVSPTDFIVGSGATEIVVYGSNFFSQSINGGYVVTSTVLWNGTALTTNVYEINSNGSGSLFAQIPANLLTSLGTASITVSSTTSTPAVSNALTVSITNPPPPTLTQLYPSGGPINTAAPLTLNGTGFTANSTVAVNGVNIPATYVNSTELTATIPASNLSPGNLNVTVTTPAPGGGTTAPLPYTAYIGLVNNDLVYNSVDGLLYASVPDSATGGIGNSIVGIDPITGNITRQIFVGSNPNKLALSTDGTQLFVGLDGSGTLVQVNLTTGVVGAPVSLGGAPGNGYAPYTEMYMAAVPGEPNSVAVATSSSFTNGNGVTIYDSGVARAKTSSSLGYGYGALSFGASASTLFMVGGTGVVELSVDPTGITGGTNFYTSSYSFNLLQYDNGRLYLSDGVVLDATSADILGTFYASTSQQASGPVASDSTLGLAFVGEGAIGSASTEVLAFNEATFNPTGSIGIGGVNNETYPYSFGKILRWGEDGVALNTSTQIYIFESPLVKDLSSSPADVSVALSAPTAATTGSAITYTVTVKNAGPNQATGVALALTLDPSLIVNSISAGQGTCGTGNATSCDLGNLANGAGTTVTVSATPTTSGTIEGTAMAATVSYDGNLSNNQATASTTVTGSVYSAVPSVSAIIPNLVQSGSGTFALTVSGTGFNSGSTINVGGTALSTTFISASELTANVTGSLIANYGWAPVTVTNPSPGGGTSPVVPLTIYELVNAPASGMVFDPYGQQIYATLPSSSTSPVGNSVVAINPITGNMGTPVNVGSEPTVIAETTDGDYLYIGLSGANSLVQFNLETQKVAETIPLSYTQGGTTTSMTAIGLATTPGNDSSLAIVAGPYQGNLGIFDVSGNTGSFRQNLANDYNENENPVFADATHLYEFDGYNFDRYGVNAQGLTLIDSTGVAGLGGSTTGGFDLANGIVYGGQGGIVNPSTTPPSQIALMSLPDYYLAGISPFGVGAVADGSTQKDFLMLENAAGTWEYALARYDTVHYLPETLLVMPPSASNVETNWTMLRFGQDGLALLSNVNNEINSGAVSEILLIRGPFVTPQELLTDSAATLSSSSSSTITHGAGNTLLTLTGTNFLPGVAVTWNGSYRTTTIVSATQVTVAIPASDLASAGSGSLVATNPGAAASNAVSVTIN